ncbi:MAG: hypothetical protein J3K34DRAFT_476020 [Monoraphidium minutum]|nr:MAG: hypothetical protein J3K34DRAFT_476020 [Monoraphidium minutum]
MDLESMDAAAARHLPAVAGLRYSGPLPCSLEGLLAAAAAAEGLQAGGGAAARRRGARSEAWLVAAARGAPVRFRPFALDVTVMPCAAWRALPGDFDVNLLPEGPGGRYARGGASEAAVQRRVRAGRFAALPGAADGARGREAEAEGAEGDEGAARRAARLVARACDLLRRGSWTMDDAGGAAWAAARWAQLRARPGSVLTRAPPAALARVAAAAGCALCGARLAGGDLVVATACCHMLHGSCLRAWMAARRCAACPECGAR